MFVAVADRKGFTAAARSLGLSTAGVSAVVARLESAVGVRLFERTTRVVRLTSAGAGFLARIRPTLEQYDEAVEEARTATRDLRGRLRVEAPLVLGSGEVGQAIAEFALANPAVEIDFRATDDVTSIEAEGVDLAVRLGPRASREQRAQRVLVTRTCICASPRYIARQGVPRDLEDLRSHRLIGFMSSRGRVFPWPFIVTDEAIDFTPRPTTLVRDGQSNLTLAREGAGLAFELDVHVRGALQSGVLVEVLRELSAPGPELRLVMPSVRSPTARTRALAKFLVRRIPELVSSS